ncbi:MAG: hypothetical protein VB092_00510 [Oscillospiraceae bacterium]|nr:hypothetical protein [Oscillospiraceae bacterium]
MPVGCTPVSMDFHCADSVVFDVLTNPKSYREWYGFPQPRELTDTQTPLSLGAKLSFRGDARTRVVTVFEPLRSFTISADDESDEFTIAPTDTGCRVSLITVLGASDWRGTEQARARVNGEILARLKKAAYARDSEITNYAPALLPDKPSRTKRAAELLSSVFQGYKSPVSRLAAARPAAVGADNTEADIRFTPRACFVALLLAALLLAVLSVSLQFERSDIVPSSGLSVLESDGIDRQHAAQIYIGQSKTSLELMLSCLGHRLSPDEYRYDSLERDENGQSLRQIFVVYDAYAKVRRFGYVDREQSLLPYTVGVCSYDAYLSPSMSVDEVDEAVGAACSAFSVDKSGLSTFFYGEFNTEKSVFSSEQKSTLVVRLNTATMKTDALYYAPYDAQDPYEITELTKALKRQYSSYSLYLADKVSYERLSLLSGLTGEQASILLAAEPASEDTVSAGVSRVYEKSVIINGETSARYLYTVVFRENVCAQASFVNLFLEQKSGMLTDTADYDLREGMSLQEVCAALGIMPSAAEITDSALSVCFGQRLAEHGNMRRSFEIVVTFDLETQLAKYIYVNA